MRISLDLIAREAALLALLLAVGAGPAAYLSERFDAGARVALAVVFGLCVGLCVTVTIEQFVPADESYWMLPLTAATSIAVWQLKRRRSPRTRTLGRSLDRKDLAQLVVVAVAVTAPLTYTLARHSTVGPADYYFTDGVSYVSQTDGVRVMSTADAAAAWARFEHTHTGGFPDLALLNWAFRASFNQNLDASPLEGNLNALLGLGATDTFDASLAVLLLCGGMGAFACIRYITRERTWVAALAGAMFGGAFFIELYYDTYQAAIVGLALLLPLVVLMNEALRRHRRADVGLAALCLGGLMTAYPLFVPLVVGALALVLATAALTRVKAKKPMWPVVCHCALTLLSIALLAVLLAPVATMRDIRYAQAIINQTIPLPYTNWSIPVALVPSWVFQTREFYAMPPFNALPSDELLVAVLLPVLFAALAVVALARFRLALTLVALAVACAVVAEYSFLSRSSCGYCAERNMLPLAPIAAALVPLGIYALVKAGPRLTWLGVIAAVAVVLGVGLRASAELRRFSADSYYMENANRALLGLLPHQGVVELEGYDASVAAQSEEGYVYDLANERAPGRVSIPPTNPNQGLAYLTFGPSSPPAVVFRPEYRYVLTRLAGIDSGRRVIGRFGPVALEKRATPLDITPVLGIQAPLARLDPAGVAWVQAPTAVSFYITGDVLHRRIWARLVFLLSVPVTIAPQPGVRTRRDGYLLSVCVPARGRAPLWTASLRLSARLANPLPQSGPFPSTVPLTGIELIAMHATKQSCQP